MTGKKSLNKRKAQSAKRKVLIQNLKFYALRFSFTLFALSFTFYCFAQDEKKEPIIVNGDKLEYSVDGREVIVTGNAEVDYKGTKLTADRLTMDMQTKDAQAEGNARLDEQQGVIEGTKMLYNFNTKKGTIIDSEFRSNPYFGKGEKAKKISDSEFNAFRGYFTTCNLDNPHYRVKSRKMKFFPGDKIQTRDDTFYLGRIPMAYIPQYTRSLKDPLMHTQFMVGKKKDWGPFTLSATRYNLTENISARLYFDYRDHFGVAEGFGANYNAQQFGKGDFKYYYTQERTKEFEEGTPAEFQRYFIRWRHQGNIDEYTSLTSEYWKIVDSKRMLRGTQYNILKDYFPLEYQVDALPLSYALLHRSFSFSTIDFLLEKRTNRWYSQTEKLPEIKYSLPNRRIGESPFYFDDSSSYVNSNSKSAVPSDSWNDSTANSLTTSNGLSLPMKAAFINLTPSFSISESYTDKGTYGATTSVGFSPGAAAETKFYRLFNINSNLLALDINGLRHIITPSVSYSYNNTSTMPSEKIEFGGNVHTATSSALLSLSNTLQTKRKGQKVDLADLLVTNTYAFKPKTGVKRGSNLSDFLIELQILPYSWLSIVSDMTYKHSGSRSQESYNHISNVNYDVIFNFDEEHSFAFGQRYVRKGGNQTTYNLIWRLSPKWKFSLYHRREFGPGEGIKRGLRQQQYIISRDLHCWTVEFTYDRQVGVGEGVWLIFRLKAFPEMEFEYDQTYHVPKPGSQSNP